MKNPYESTRGWPALFGGLLILTLAVGVSAQSDQTDDEIRIPKTATLDADVVRIPFKLKQNKIYVEVNVNGQGPFPFIFDTGAGGTVLDKSFADELKLPVVGESEIGDPSGSQQIPVDLVGVDEMTIGGLTVKDFRCTSWDQSSLIRFAEPPKGIIGFPVFHDFLLTVDYETSELVVTKGVLSPSEDHVIPFTSPEGIAEMSSTVNGKPVVTHIDTGAPHGIMVPQQFLADDAIDGEPVVFGRGRTVNSEFEIKGARITGTIEIAGHVIEDPFIMLNDLFPAVNFGYSFLKHFRVTFDQVNQLVRFDPVSDEPIVLNRPQMRRGGHGH